MMKRNLTRLLAALTMLSLASGCGLKKSASAIMALTGQSSLEGASAESQAAFAVTLYPIVKANCIQCHASTQTPHFASSNEARAHEAALSRVSLATPSSSVMARKAGDGHCGTSCQTSRPVIEAGIQAWADQLNSSTQATAIFWLANSGALAEATGTHVLRVQSTRPVLADVTVPIQLSGTAIVDADYSISAPSSVTIPAGASEAQLTLTAIDDAVYEGGETITVSLGQPTGGVSVQGATVATVTLTDNEVVPTVRWQATAMTVSESAGSTNLISLLSGPASREYRVPYVVSGTATVPSDHGLVSGEFVFAAGAVQATATIQLVSDAVAEVDETIIATLAAANGILVTGTAAAVVTVSEGNVPLVVQWGSASQTAAESLGQVQLQARLNSPRATTVTVPYTVSGTAVSPADHSLVSGTVTFAANTTTSNVTFNVVDDALNEASETVVVTLGAPSGGSVGTPSAHTVTITDNDPMPVVKWQVGAQNIAEGAGTASAVLVLDQASGLQVTAPYTVGGSATSASDFTLVSGSAVFPPGSVSQTISIPIVNDSLVEPSDETVTLSLGPPTGATRGTPTVHAVTILDNDSTGQVGAEAFRTTVYPLVRSNCISCHNAQQSPEFASDNVLLAYGRAKTKVTFQAIPTSTLVLKTKDTHCGAACMTDGAAMTAAITAWWNQGEMQVQPSPSPSPSSSSTPTPSSSPSPSPSPSATTPPQGASIGGVALRDFRQFPASLAAVFELSYGAPCYTAEGCMWNQYRTVALGLSGDGDAQAVSPPMMFAYAGTAGIVCEQFINKDAAPSNPAANRLVHAGYDYFANPSTITTAMRRTLIDNYAALLWQRAATPAEEAILLTLMSETGLYDGPYTSKTYNMSFAVCAAMGASLDGIRR